MSRQSRFTLYRLAAAIARRGPVVALVVAVLASTAMRVEATPFDMTYYFSDTTSTFFGGGDNAIRIRIDNVCGPFDTGCSPFSLGVGAEDLEQIPFGPFAGSNGLPYGDGDGVQYVVTPSGDYTHTPGTDSVHITIGWLAFTPTFSTQTTLIQGEDPGYLDSKALDNIVRFFESTGGICFGESCDNGIAGDTDGFSPARFAVVNPVPEPSTLALLAMGLVLTMSTTLKKLKHRGQPVP